jgi:hypothetical protein
MQRDFNLIRSILLKIESTPAGIRLCSNELADDGHNLAIVAEHIEILRESGLIDTGEPFADPETGVKHCSINRLTWQGHEFLANAKNDTIWKKAMAQAQEKGISMSIVVLNGVLTKLAQKLLGLE